MKVEGRAGGEEAGGSAKAERRAGGEGVESAKVRREGDEFLRTCWRVLREPADFFSRPTTKRSRWRPIAFTTAVTALTLSLGSLANALVAGEVTPAAFGAAFGAFVVSPVVALGSLYFTAGLTHFWLRVARAKPLPFKETRESVAYTSAAHLVGIVPVVGALLGVVWHTVVLVVALKRTHGSSRGRVVFAVLAGLTTPVALAVGLRAGVVEAFKIPAGSMLPTLMPGDHLFVNKLDFGPRWVGGAPLWARPPHRGEVLVFEFPENPNQDFIKRVIGLPGDQIEFKGGHPVINGWGVPSCVVGSYSMTEGGSGRPRRAEMAVEFLGAEAYLTIYDRTFPSEPGEVQGPYVVKPGEFWVVGDNRHNSHDSRSWFGGRGGGVPLANFKGRAMFVWLHVGENAAPFDRFLLDVHGPPALQAARDASLHAGLERCLKARPPLDQTMPPPPPAGRASAASAEADGARAVAAERRRLDSTPPPIPMLKVQSGGAASAIARRPALPVATGGAMGQRRLFVSVLNEAP